MSNLHKHLHSETADMKLSISEKNLMRSEIHDYMRSHPLARKQPWSIAHYLKIVSPVATVLLLSGGTAFAAQSALPGDVLYSVKISVNEKVVAALQATPESEARYEAKLARTRLQEAEALADQNKLTPQITAQLADDFAVHASAAASFAAATSTSAAPAVATEIDKVQAESEVLSEIGDHRGDGTKDQAQILVRHAIQILAQRRKNPSVAAAAHDNQKGNANLVQAIQSSMSELTQNAQDTKKDIDLDATTSALLDARVAQTKALANEALDSTSTEQVVLSQHALRAEAILNVYLNAKNTLKDDSTKGRILTRLLLLDNAIITRSTTAIDATSTSAEHTQTESTQ